MAPSITCIFCLCDITTDYVSCKGYGCNLVACTECVSVMVDVCFKSIGAMPTCTCGCEYVMSQLEDVLDAELLQKYITLCRRTRENVKTAPRVDRGASKAIRDQMVLQVLELTRKDLQDALPPAIVKLMQISGLEMKLIAAHLKTVEKTKKDLSQRKCVSFICNGVLIVNDGVLKCNKCKLLVCGKCDAVRSPTSHECKNEEVETMELLKHIAKCPTCGIPATKGEGCIFVTCPICKTDFDSKTGEATKQGGHDNGLIVGLAKHTQLTELVPESDTRRRLLLIKIKKARPTSSKKKCPAVKYEDVYKVELWTRTINRLFELKDLSVESLTNILRYMKSL